ncbi:hypothetical protein [Bacillus toyonensis]|uniref:hypothetical protein n=1 Tax=Bacillus toyonensis TaxID=155322 RepID=UPI0015CF11C1|nr:hypothetical protein [Bacillus toyonensis]
MKCRLFFGFLLVILLGGCIAKEVMLYTIPKGLLVNALKETLRFLFPIKLPFQANSFSFKQFIH